MIEGGNLKERIRNLTPEARKALARRIRQERGGTSTEGGEAGRQQLIAYVASDPQSGLDSSQLREFLRAKLPAYMVPSAFVVLDALPRTPNGKIDTDALAHALRDAGTRDGYCAPRTETEKRIVEIWRSVLSLDRVGIHDSFVELGGHSLLAMGVIGQLNDAFDVKLPISVLFETSSVAELAARVEGHRSSQTDIGDSPSHSGTGGSAVPLVRVPRNGGLPLSLAQQGLWFMDQLEPGNPFYNVYCALRMRGPVDLAILQRGLIEIVRRHEILRTRFVTIDGQGVQVVAPSSVFNLPVLDRRETPDEEKEAELMRLAITEFRRPFDLSVGPLLRVTLVQLAPEEHALLLTMHHTIADLWSAGLLLRELGLLYRAFADGAPSPLPELPVQYADFAHWQRSWLSGEFVENQIAYWKRQLEGVSPILSLPTDRPRPEEMSFRGARRRARIPASLKSALESFSRAQGVTLFMSLLAAYKVLLYRFSGETDICVASPVTDRKRTELESLIGYFLNTVVLRTDLSGNPSFEQLLKRVRVVCLGALEHQDVPAERVLDALHVRRSLGHVPLTQIGFALQNAPIGELTLPDITLEAIDVDAGMAKCDLALVAWEEQGGLSVVLEYSTDLFDAETVDRMLTAFGNILEGVVDNPEQRILGIPVWKDGTEDAPELPTAPRGEVGAWDASDDVYARTNLTKNQFLIWAGQKLVPDVPLFNVAVYFTLHAAIDRERFQGAIQALVDGSDAMRTVIDEVDGLPSQRVLPRLKYELTYYDLSQTNEPRTELRRWVEKESYRPFDLGARLFDAALLKLSPDCHVWFLRMHHLITDARTVGLCYARVEAAYRKSLSESSRDSGELHEFQDYVVYERAQRGRPQYDKARLYWERKLANEIEPVTFYRGSLRKQTTRVNRVACELGSERSRKLRELAERPEFSALGRNFSMFNLFAGILLTFLHRLSGNRRLSIGTSLANRPSAAFKNTIGLFMQMAVLQIEIESEDTFVSLCRKIKADMREVMRHQRYTVRNLPQRSAYDVVLNYQFESETPEFNGYPARVDWVHTGHENDSLAVQVHDFERSGSFVLECDFHCDVFGPEEQARAVKHLLHVTDAVLEEFDRPVTSIPLMAEDERRRVLFEFNPAESALPAGESVVELFEAQVERTPDAPALVQGETTLTYEELNRSADQLAFYLRSRGLGPGTVVGLCLHRSPEMVIAIWAVLKAGAAYLPLNPDDPADRLAFMLDDAQVALLLTREELLPHLPESFTPVVCLDRDADAISRVPERRRTSRPTREDAAYVIYTSGSTGTPRGVQVPHRTLSNYAVVARDMFALNRDDRVLQFASISFDTAVEEIFPTLLCGAQLVLRNDAMLDSVSEFLSCCDKWQLSVLDLPTAFWHELTAELDSGYAELPASLRLVIVGGDRMLPDRVRMWHENAPPRVRLMNTYGPTEATVVATGTDLATTTPREPDRAAREVTIGRPIDGARIYILDRHLEPVPIEVPGEIFIAGRGVANGYLGRPDATAERFIPSPICRNPGARMYRTGDRACFRADGTIEFLGRIDHQVKIHGYRVETGEVEHLLGLHPDVREAVVVARRGTSDEKQLAAYVVCKTSRPTLGELRSHLQRRCPDYMIPASFTFLESFPLTSSGKVDRRALPEPERTRTNLETRYVPPSTEREQMLADILAELLGVDRVGVHDNFFELGGDSILAIQAVSRAGRAGLSITPRQLFQYQTIAELAPVAGLSTSISAEQGVVEGHVALTPIQKHFFGGDQVDRHHFNQSVLLECEEPLDLSALRSALRHILVHHDALRMRFERTDSGWKQWNAGLDVADADSVLSVVNLDSAATSELRLQIERNAAKLQASLNLTDGPLIRAGYFDLGGNRPHRLLLVIHHLVVDGVSWRILLEDLLAAYQSILHGGPVTLPPKTTSFQEWARRMLDHTRSSSDLRSELAHWLADGVPAAPRLPVDHELGENTIGSTEIVTVSLPADETRALLRDVPAAYHTQISDALVTALTQAVSGWTGEGTLLLAMEGHGRESLFDGVDVSRTVGWFTSLFPARLTLDADATGKALKSIKEQLRRIPNRGFGYGWLHMTDDAEITRALASRPEPEVTFNYLGQFDNVLPDGVPFRLASESGGPLASPRAKRKQLLDVIGSVTENTMKVHWVFSRNFHRRETIQRLADDFLRRVRAIIAHCQSPEAGGYTASDFPDANLNEEELDNILAELSEQ